MAGRAPAPACSVGRYRDGSGWPLEPVFGTAREEQRGGPASVTLRRFGLGYPSPTPALAWQERGWGRGWAELCSGGGRNSVGNHSNEAMKPKPCLRTNWPDLAWSRGANGVEEVGPGLRRERLSRKNSTVWPQEFRLWMSKRDSYPHFLS